MKRKLPMLLESAVLSMLCTWGAAGCLLSAFSLSILRPNRVMLIWVLWTLLCGVLLLFRFGQAAVLCIGAAGAFWLWLEGSFGPQLLSTLGEMAEIYHQAYGWGIPEVLRRERMASDWPLTVLGMLLIFAVSRAVCRRKSNALAVLLLLVPLAACLLVTDTVPEEVYLFALLLGLSLLLLTDSVRRESGTQAARLTVTAAIPVALALGLLLHFCPRDSYVNTTGELRDKILLSVSQIPQKFQAQAPQWLTGLGKKETVNLSSLPSQLLLGVPIAEVNAQQSGPVYLRLQDYDVYTGTAWESTSNRQEALVGAGGERGWVELRILNAQTNLLPCFPEGQSFLSGGTGEGEGQRESTLQLRTAAMGPFPGEQWLRLPEDTSARAKALLQTLSGERSTVEETVAAVAGFVRSSAVYDRTGTEMPPEETDFALWFLEQADRGYCVHFATAAVVLLRSAGIPARYVTGYRTDALAGETLRVTSDDAHAWAEYYDYRSWTWNILEVTPGDDSQPAPAPLTEPTELSQTEPQTQPSQTVPTQAPEPETIPASRAPEKTSPTIPLWVPLAVFGLGLFAAALESQRLLRISLRRRAQRRGNNNQRAAACCKEIRLLTLLLKRPLPAEVERLTEKALFSQHTLTREELNVFLSCQAACRRALRAAPWWKKLGYRYWYAVI